MAKETDEVVKPVFSHTNAWSKEEEEPVIKIAKKIDGVIKPVFSNTNAWSKQEKETETNVEAKNT